MDVDDEELNVEAKTEDAKEFRFNAVKVFLTYPQCGDLTWDDVLSYLNLLGNGLKEYAICSEVHQDGGNHIHCYAKWNKKLNTYNPRQFDVKEVHPNIHKVKDVQGVIEYIMKEGNYKTQNIELFPNSKGFLRKKMDHDAWKMYKVSKTQRDLDYPILLPQGMGLIEKPDARIKKRHWWITGPSGCGKTLWANDVFANAKIYVRPAGAIYPFEGYQDQEIILYDDVNMDGLLEELKSVTNTWKMNVHVYGMTRYKKEFWPINKARTVIVLSNWDSPYFQDAAFLGRFNVVRLKSLEDAPTPIINFDDELCVDGPQ